MTENLPQPAKTAANGEKFREVNSSELMQGEREIHIRHGQEVYQLRITRNGKLVLRK